jgi:ATP-dependent DNA helicase DinG
VLPEYDAVVFDEAHQIEDIATQFFGVRVSQTGIERLLRELERTFGRAQPTHDAARVSSLRELREASTLFWRELRAGAPVREPRSAVERDFWNGSAREAWFRLDSALEGVTARLATTREDTAALSDALQVAETRVAKLREQVAEIIDGAPGRVTWLEVGDRNASLSSSPVDISAILSQRLFDVVPSAILTSATLSDSKAERNGSPFTFFKRRVGIADSPRPVRETCVLSPFDYESRAILYLPRDLPLPSDSGFADRAAERTCDLIELTAGGAFVLTTSLKSMRELAVRIAASLPRTRLLVQGDASKPLLIERFRAEQDAVLVATMGFWEGVDVPGRALRLVVLDKIPFVVPTDPIVRARAVVLEREGKNPFRDLHVPAAALALKQGFGRLIRTTADRGIVALLDPRVHQRGYGKKLLEPLPPARREYDLERVRERWQAMWSEDADGQRTASAS